MSCCSRVARLSLPILAAEILILLLALLLDVEVGAAPEATAATSFF
jgi:hypothetical protein